MNKECLAWPIRCLCNLIIGMSAISYIYLLLGCKHAGLLAIHQTYQVQLCVFYLHSIPIFIFLYVQSMLLTKYKCHLIRAYFSDHSKRAYSLSYLSPSDSDTHITLFLLYISTCMSFIQIECKLLESRSFICLICY